MGDKSIVKLLFILSMMIAVINPPAAEAGTEPDPEPIPGPSEDGYFNLTLEGDKIDSRPLASMHKDDEGGTIIISYSEGTGSILYSRIDGDGNTIVRSRPLVDAEIFLFYHMDNFQTIENREGRINIIWVERDHSGGKDNSKLDLFHCSMDSNGKVIRERTILIEGVYSLIWDGVNNEFYPEGWYVDVDIGKNGSMLISTQDREEFRIHIFNRQRECIFLDNTTIADTVIKWDSGPVQWIDGYDELNLLVLKENGTITYYRYRIIGTSLDLMIERDLFAPEITWWGRPFEEGFIINHYGTTRKYDRNATSYEIIDDPFKWCPPYTNHNGTMYYRFSNPGCCHGGMPTMDMDVFLMNGTPFTEDIPVLRYLNQRNDRDVVHDAHVRAFHADENDNITLLILVNSFSGSRLFLVGIDRKYELTYLERIAPIDMPVEEMGFRDLTEGYPTTGDPFRVSFNISKRDIVSHARIEYDFGLVDDLRYGKSIPEGSSLFETEIDMHPCNLGALIYRLIITDHYGKEYSSPEYFREIKDNDPPEIEILSKSQQAGSGDTVNFTVEFADNLRLAGTDLRMDHPLAFKSTDIETTTQPMKLHRKIRIFSVEVPLDLEGVVEFNFTASDPSGNINWTGPIIMVITDGVAPYIGEIKDFSIRRDEQRRITVLATDNIGIREIVWKENGKILSRGKTADLGFSGIGDHRIVVEAADLNGNTASMSFNILVYEDGSLSPAPEGEYSSNITPVIPSQTDEEDEKRSRKWNVSDYDESDLDWMEFPDAPPPANNDGREKEPSGLMIAMVAVCIFFSLTVAFIVSVRKVRENPEE